MITALFCADLCRVTPTRTMISDRRQTPRQSLTQGWLRWLRRGRAPPGDLFIPQSSGIGKYDNIYLIYWWGSLQACYNSLTFEFTLS